MEGRFLPWKKEQLGFVKTELEVVCRHPLRNISQTQRFVLPPGFQTGEKLSIICIAVVGKTM